ncbi:MAG: polyhydroxyalkanoate depolymerase, partial [Alphaproteobacteria bacterium]|nr:polyhydroxyalkanoate depolymerase [Alphaproteobacteria bacterium]
MNRFAYHMYEMTHLALAPARAFNDAARLAFRNPLNPWSHTPLGKNFAASTELFERVTRRYGKPAFDLPQTTVNGVTGNAEEQVVWERPFCRLLRFARALPPDAIPSGAPRQDRLLIVAPMSGHYATLLRGTVEAFLPHFDVYITDWADARMVPLSSGRFDLDDYVEYLIEMFEFFYRQDSKTAVHAIGVCQPSVPLIAAIALMERRGNAACPASITLMGGPIDTRRSPTEVNQLAQQRGTEWFARNCVITAPFPYPGMGREVYPGFLQLSGFMAMNIDRHVSAHLEMFNHLVEGDGDSAEKHREFYDEYLAVMDLDAAFYLQTVETVFVKHSLPRGEMMHRSEPVDLKSIRKT